MGNNPCDFVHIKKWFFQTDVLQLAQDVELMQFQCWATVYEASQTLNQYLLWRIRPSKLFQHGDGL